MDFFQQLILGLVQGIAEWIPISSEGFLLLVKNNFFGEVDIDIFVRQALLLHLGTFFAAVIYFRKDLKELWRGALNYKKSDHETQKVLRFLLITTIISGVLGLAILKLMEFINLSEIPLTSSTINLGIGILLLFTGFLQLKASSAGFKRIHHLKTEDGIILGLAQGFAALPGLSRSGLTVSTFLFRNFDETQALRLSFIMSLPIVLLGNIMLNFSDLKFVLDIFWGILFSFLFGLLTINLLMKFSKKVKFGHFVIFFGLLSIIAGVVNLFV